MSRAASALPALRFNRINQRQQALAVGGVSEVDTQILAQAGIGDTLVLAVKTARHWGHVVIAHGAALLRMDAPPLIGFDEADLAPMARSFYGENKRVSNRRIKRDLGVQLRYPDYQTGLRALFDAGEGRG